MREIRKDLLSKEIIDAEIMSAKKVYIDVLKQAYTTPIMLEMCEKAVADAKFDGNKERVSGLEQVIATHKSNEKAYGEAQEMQEKTVDYLISLRNQAE